MFKNHPTMPGWSRIESGCEVTAPQVDKKHFLWKVLFPSASLQVRECKNGLEQREREREGELDVEIKAPWHKAHKCSSLLLGSGRCAGLVTLATGNGVEHLIGETTCERVCVSHVGEGKWKNRSILYLHQEKAGSFFLCPPFWSSGLPHTINKKLLSLMSQTVLCVGKSFRAISPASAAATRPFWLFQPFLH